MTVRNRTQSFLQNQKISDWNADQLSRFCEVGYQMAKRQFGARLNVIIKDEDGRRELILTGLMEEMEIITENLIVLALDYGHLKAANLRHGAKDEKKKPTRTLILTEERD